MALCTQLQVEQRLQWDITAEPEAVVTQLIASAQALIEAEIGRPVESGARTETLNPDSPVLFLTYWPVTAVTSVTVDGTALAAAEYQFYRNGLLVRVANGHPRGWGITKDQSVVAVYTGGWETGDVELTHLSSVCADVVARAFRQGAASAAIPAGAGLGGVTSVSLAGSDAVSYGTVGGQTIELGGGLSRFVFLLDSERQDIARYRTLGL